jgi:hypothetical protein
MRNETAAVAWVFVGVIAILASACSNVPSSGLSSAKTGRVELSEEFKNGEARLGCRLHCAVTWGLYRDRAKALYNARAWNELALNVLRIGYADDLSYFYLGKAAEGLGQYRAAESYYRLSRSASLKCADIYGDCYGFVFPRDARSAPAVANKAAEVKRQYSAPPTAAPAHESAAPAAETSAQASSERGGAESNGKEAKESKFQTSPAGRGDAQRVAGAKPSEPEKRPPAPVAKKLPPRKSVQQADVSNHPAEAKTPPAPAPPVVEKQTPEAEPPAPPPSVSYEEVSRKFGSHSPLTDAQKGDEWKKYQGRCVEWSGELSYVGDSFIRGLTLGFKHDPRTLTYDVLVSAPDNARDAALRMKKGGHYTYRGTLKKYGGAVLPISLSWGCSAGQRGGERAKAE